MHIPLGQPSKKKYHIVVQYFQGICEYGVLTSELPHLEKALMQCKYLKCAINKVLQKQQHQQKDTTNERHIPSGQPTKKKYHIVVPYL